MTSSCHCKWLTTGQQSFSSVMLHTTLCKCAELPCKCYMISVLLGDLSFLQFYQILHILNHQFVRSFSIAVSNKEVIFETAIVCTTKVWSSSQKQELDSQMPSLKHNQK